MYTACESPQKTEEAKAMDDNKEIKIEYTDHHSFSKPDEARVTHLDWDAEVNFDQKVILATATYTIENIKGVDTIHLDYRNLEIVSVGRDDFEGELGYTAHDKSEPLPFRWLLATRCNRCIHRM